MTTSRSALQPTLFDDPPHPAPRLRLMKRSEAKALLKMAEDMVAVRKHDIPVVRARIKRYRVMLGGGLDPEGELTLVED